MVSRSELGHNEKQEQILVRAADELNSQADLDEFSSSVRSHEDVCQELAGRQEQALQAASQDLLCSPDIIR